MYSGGAFIHLRTAFQTSPCGMKAREERQVFMHLFYGPSDFSVSFTSHQCALDLMAVIFRIGISCSPAPGHAGLAVLF